MAEGRGGRGDDIALNRARGSAACEYFDGRLGGKIETNMKQIGRVRERQVRKIRPPVPCMVAVSYRRMLPSLAEGASETSATVGGLAGSLVEYHASWSGIGRTGPDPAESGERGDGQILQHRRG